MAVYWSNVVWLLYSPDLDPLCRLCYSGHTEGKVQCHGSPYCGLSEENQMLGEGPETEAKVWRTCWALGSCLGNVITLTVAILISSQDNIFTYQLNQFPGYIL
jgi:hypothetical protein